MSSDEKRSAQQQEAGNQIDNYLAGNSPSGPGQKNSGQPAVGKESTDQTQTDENEGGSGKEETTVTSEQYKELEKKLGSQGEELGKYRKLFEDTRPLLEKLDNDPQLAQAILEEKIDSSLIQDVVEGKTSKKDAETVSQANKEVKEEVGENQYNKMSSQDIEKMVDDKVGEKTKEFDQKLDEKERLQKYEEEVSSFIAKTDDFAEYADEIYQLLDETGISDIEVAYNAVKGKQLQKKQQEQTEEEQTEAAKSVASNAAGGSSQTSGKLDSDEGIDAFLGKRSNPNEF